MQAIEINSQRIWQSLMDMAEIGATEKGGCCRLALTELDRQGRDLFVDWCQQAGCTITLDKIGNIFARRAGTDATASPICTGSHLDTQPTGGRFDGIYGCLAGLEVIRSLNDHGIETKRPIEVSVWTNEEGSRFAPAMIASGVFSGKFSLDYALKQQDSDGISVEQALQGIGYQGLQEVGAQQMHQFYELHIEQGPVLEREQEQIGIVTGVLGMRWFDVKVEGVSAHAGPTPMHYRRDALYASAQVFSALYQLAEEDAVGSARCTVGELNVEKASRNVIPGAVTFSLDLRHSHLQGLENLEAAANAIIETVSSQTNTQITLQRIWDSPPLEFDHKCVSAVEQAVNKSGFSHRKMVSGAGHDAVNISSVVPTSMIFVPSIGGISHNEAEYSSPEQIAAGTQVLFDVMLAQSTI